MKRATWALAMLALLLSIGVAMGGWLDGITRLGKTARRTASHGQGALELATAHVASLPAGTGRTALAAAVSHQGHWRLVNRAGETITAAGAEELSHAIQVLVPDAAGQKGRQLALYLAEDTAFEHRALIKELPRQAELFVVAGHEAFPLLRKGEGAAASYYAEVRPRVVVEVGNREAFDEALWQLARPFNRADVRVIALQPGGPAGLSSVPKFDQATRRPLIDAIDPDRLRHVLPSLNGQTVLVTGRVEGELLYFKPASGAERSLLLRDIVSAAETADVNLVILRSSSARQPGARNWLWRTVEVENLQTAFATDRLADFLSALRGDSGRMLVTAAPRQRLRVEIEARPALGLPGEASGNPLATTLSETLAEVTATVVVHGVTANLRHSDRQLELDDRLVPGIPAAVQHYALGAVLLGLLSLPMARRWWGRIWPPEVASEYASPLGFRAARATRQLAFFGLFLPLAGSLSFLATIVEQVLGALSRLRARRSSHS